MSGIGGKAGGSLFGSRSEKLPLLDLATGDLNSVLLGNAQVVYMD